MKKILFSIMVFAVMSIVGLMETSKSVDAAAGFSIESNYENMLGDYSSWMFEVGTSGTYEISGLPSNGSVELYRLEENLPSWPPKFVGAFVKEVRNKLQVDLDVGKYYFVNPKNLEAKIYIDLTRCPENSLEDKVIVPLPYFKVA